MKGKRWLVLVGVVAALLSLALLVGCGDEDGGGEPTATEGLEEPTATEEGTPAEGTAVDVTLQEFAVIPDPTSVAAGAVAFNVENVGPADPHEFMVIKTDLDADALPTLDDGSVDETDPNVEVIEEIEEDELPVDGSASRTISLEAGSYVLICNLVEEEDGTESHYQEGMRVDFEVTE